MAEAATSTATVDLFSTAIYINPTIPSNDELVSLINGLIPVLSTPFLFRLIRNGLLQWRTQLSSKQWHQITQLFQSEIAPKLCVAYMFTLESVRQRISKSDYYTKSFFLNAPRYRFKKKHFWSGKKQLSYVYTNLRTLKCYKLNFKKNYTFWLFVC